MPLETFAPLVVALILVVGTVAYTFGHGEGVADEQHRRRLGRRRRTRERIGRARA